MFMSVDEPNFVGTRTVAFLRDPPSAMKTSVIEHGDTTANRLPSPVRSPKGKLYLTAYHQAAAVAGAIRVDQGHWSLRAHPCTDKRPAGGPPDGP